MAFSAAAALALAIAVPAALAEHAWERLTPAPEPVEGACTDAIGNNIYVAFGFSNGDSNRLRIYDIDKNTWSFGPSAPTVGRSEGYRGVAHGGRLYCVGGRPTPETWRFVPSTSTWEQLAPYPVLPEGLRVGATAAGWNDSIYMFGGREGFTPCSTLAKTSILRYDIDLNQWFPAGKMQIPRSDATSGEVGGKIYIFGGCDTSGRFHDTVEVYDPRTETSTLLPVTMPGGGRANPATAVDDQAEHEFHVTGGWRFMGPVTDVQPNHIVLDIDKQVFTIGTPMPKGNCPPGAGRAEHELVYHKGRIYAVTGACPAFGTSLRDLDRLKLSP
jgi:N-acetylneuraminic acid mutarotase